MEIKNEMVRRKKNDVYINNLVFNYMILVVFKN